jgi:hypothetical protein
VGHGENRSAIRLTWSCLHQSEGSIGSLEEARGPEDSLRNQLSTQRSTERGCLRLGRRGIGSTPEGRKEVGGITLEVDVPCGMSGWGFAHRERPVCPASLTAIGRTNGPSWVGSRNRAVC